MRYTVAVVFLALGCNFLTDFGSGAGLSGGGGQGGVFSSYDASAGSIDAASSRDSAQSDLVSGEERDAVADTDSDARCRLPRDCEDGNQCTIDSCVDGSCVFVLRGCDDGIACTIDRCDLEVGCVHEPDDSACLDNDSCTTDQCVGDAAPSGCVHRTISRCIPCDRNEECPQAECAPCATSTIDGARICTYQCSSNRCERHCGICTPVCTVP